MSKLADYGLSIETTASKRWLKRDGVGVPITSLQRDMLEWFDGAKTASLEYCCDELWEQVDVEWVRSQWDKLASLMTPLGAAVLMDDSDMLFIGHVDAEGSPVQPALEDGPAEVSTLTIAPEIATDLDNEVGELRHEVERLLGLNQVLLDLRHQALCEGDQARAEVDELRACNVKLAEQVSSALASLSEAEAEIKRLQQAQAQPSAEIVRLREEPVRIAPHYLTVPVSEVLFRWLEATGDRNRRSADDVARALLVAFMRSAGNREAA